MASFTNVRAHALAAVVVATFARLHSLGAEPRHDERTAAAVAKLSKDYRLTIVESGTQFPVKTFHGDIQGIEADHKNVASYLPLLLREWNLYPPELVRRTGLRRLILCEALAFAGQLRTAIPDFEHNDLYLDVGRGRFNELYVRKVIHHEFYHIIDYRDDGSLYSDDQWTLLNPRGFKDGAGGKNVQNDSSVSLINDDVPGFLNRYAMTGVEEDKAEIFANMLVSGRYLEERAQNDEVIRAKIQRMKQLLQKFCPPMDEQFWETTAKTARPNP